MQRSESNTWKFPPEFDAVHYQAIHPDLGHMQTEELAQHWIHQGIKEGRQGGRVADHHQFAALIPDNAKVLEIGPFNRPLKTGPDVKYFDVLDRDELIQRAQKIGYETSRIPSKIDYVSAAADLGIVKEKFDFVLTCHSIEHQPNLVRHLMDVERLLEPGGCYFLVVPDKRFCFDHFMPETPLSLIIEAYINNHTRHPLHSVLEHRMLTTHNDPLLHWQGNHGERHASLKIRYDIAMEEYRSAEGGYIDVHAWYFTPESFRETISALATIFPLSLTPIRIYPTRYSDLEFFAILKKTQSGPS
jgi:SAM-dependent methyltransferase